MLAVAGLLLSVFNVSGSFDLPQELRCLPIFAAQREEPSNYPIRAREWNMGFQCKIQIDGKFRSWHKVLALRILRPRLRLTEGIQASWRFQFEFHEAICAEFPKSASGSQMTNGKAEESRRFQTLHPRTNTHS